MRRIKSYEELINLPEIKELEKILTERGYKTECSTDENENDEICFRLTKGYIVFEANLMVKSINLFVFYNNHENSKEQEELFSFEETEEELSEETKEELYIARNILKDVVQKYEYKIDKDNSWATKDFESIRKYISVDEQDRMQKEMAEEISKMLGGCDVNCIGLETNDKREFEIPVVLCDGVTRMTRIEYQFDEDLSCANEYGQILESHWHGVNRQIREEKASENSKKINGMMEG